MGLQVALCHTCNTAQEGADIALQNSHEKEESESESHLQHCHPVPENSVQNNPSSSSSLQGLKQFAFDCASHGFHVYRDVWSPRIGQQLDIEQDNANVHDPFAMAHYSKCDGKLVYWETVGYLPREISRFCYYFVNYGDSLEGCVRDSKYRPSPIPSGGLEVFWGWGGSKTFEYFFLGGGGGGGGR